MNAKTKAAVMAHGLQLLQIFPKATEPDPVKLCTKLRRLEREGAAFGLRLCNGPEFASEAEADAIQARILERVQALLDYRGAGVPVFVNRDPRGYALKIRSEYMRERLQEGRGGLRQDWGGYGIIAPDLAEK